MDYFRMIENNRNRVIGYNKVNYKLYGKGSEYLWKFCNR